MPAVILLSDMPTKASIIRSCRTKCCDIRVAMAILSLYRASQISANSRNVRVFMTCCTALYFSVQSEACDSEVFGDVHLRDSEAKHRFDLPTLIGGLNVRHFVVE